MKSTTNKKVKKKTDEKNIIQFSKRNFNFMACSVYVFRIKFFYRIHDHRKLCSYWFSCSACIRIGR